MTLVLKFHDFSQNCMENLLMCTSQLPNIRCYHGNREIKGAFAVLDISLVDHFKHSDVILRKTADTLLTIIRNTK